MASRFLPATSVIDSLIPMDTPPPSGLRSRVEPSRAAEVLAAVGLIVWRLWDLALLGVWRDWLTILAAFWLITAMTPDRPWRRYLAAATVVVLMAIYAVGQAAPLGSTGAGVP